MKKNTWIKPEFEVETFVPNNYIAACTITVPNEHAMGYLVEDTNHDGEFTGTFTHQGNHGELSGTVDNVFPRGNSQQKLNEFSSNEPIPKHHQFIENAVLFSTDNGTNWDSYNAVIADLEGEKNMIIFTSSPNNS